jgi:peptide deformylase
MAARPIVQLGDPVLRGTAKRVHRFDESLRHLVDDMIDTLDGAGGVGLAAPQIAVPLRVIITNLDEKQHIIVNPEIVYLSEDSETADEACLSIVGYAGPVERSLRAEVRGFNEKGKKVKLKGDDWFARVLQHEMDHLNGILYIDHIVDKSLIHPSDENYEVESQEDIDAAEEAEPERSQAAAS